MTKSKQRFETIQLHAGQETTDPQTGALAVPIYQTASYKFNSAEQAADRFALRDSGNIYGRLTNPTQNVFEQRIAALEGGVAALAVASGAAAVTYAIKNIASAGDHVVAANNLYGGTYNLIYHTLKRDGVESSFVDIHDPEAISEAIKPNTKLIFIESLGNPNCEISDIETIAKIAHDNGIPLIVDNTFGTPYLIRPIEHGADIVVHSATKFIGGHGTSLGGVIIDSGNFDWKQNDKFPNLSEPSPSYHGAVFADAAGRAAFVVHIRAVLLRDTGSAISPFNAFTLLQGLETLSLRVERHISNALKVVEYLSSHHKVKAIHHPSLNQKELYTKYYPNGAGSIFTFEVGGGVDEAWEFINSLQLFSLVANIADVKSLVIHPYTTTHSQLTQEELQAQAITPSSIRLSVGTEHIDDIIEDLDNALSNI